MAGEFSSARIEEFRAHLLRLKEETILTVDQSRSASATVELDQNRVGRLSRMDAMQGQAMAQAGLARQHRVLQDIDKALGKITRGEFGRCEECDDWIQQARLEFDPTSSHCVSCATQLES